MDMEVQFKFPFMSMWGWPVVSRMAYERTMDDVLMKKKKLIKQGEANRT